MLSLHSTLTQCEFYNALEGHLPDKSLLKVFLSNAVWNPAEKQTNQPQKWTHTHTPPYPSLPQTPNQPARQINKSLSGIPNLFLDISANMHLLDIIITQLQWTKQAHRFPLEQNSVYILYLALIITGKGGNILECHPFVALTLHKKR